MESITYSNIAQITSGKANTIEDFPVTGVETDSRRVQKGDMYVAIIGAKADGHEFIEDAAKAGAVCALVSKPIPASIPLLIVPSPERALHQLAKFYFAKIAPYTVAVTGSSGKTTTKEMLFEVFSRKYHTLKTIGNYNSTIGLPLTVCRLDSSFQAAVLEMGTGHPGEIPEMCDIVHPDIAVITNIGTSHIEFFGSKEAIRQEKCALFHATKPSGTVVINADDDLLAPMVNDLGIQANKITFGIENAADVTAQNIISSPDENGNGYKTEFELRYQGQAISVTLSTLGLHNVMNALAAAAAGIAAGISLADIASALASFVPDDMRMKIFRCMDGVTVISDIYNSNPEAAHAALKVLEMTSGQRKIAILGDMLEQGSFSQSAHINLGKAAGQCADIIIARGNMSEYIISGAADSLSYKRLFSCATNEEAIAYLSTFDFRRDDVILVKGSRGMKMEEIVEYIKTKRFIEA